MCFLHRKCPGIAAPKAIGRGDAPAENPSTCGRSRPFFRLGCLSLAILWAGPVVAANGQDDVRRGSPQLGISAECLVRRDAPVWVSQDGRIVTTDRVFAGEILVLPAFPVEASRACDGSEVRWIEYVRHGRVVVGWVPADCLVNLAAMRDRARRLVNSLPTTGEPVASDERRAPALIRMQSEPVQRTWRVLEQVIAENQQHARQAKTSELPEPYLARAELWSLVGNHEDAMDDLGRAATLARASNAAPADFARAFVELEQTLRTARRLPGRVHVAEALAYWNDAAKAFRKRRWDVAVAALTDAIQLDPRRPLYWYWRAWVLREMRLDELAERDVRRGVSAEAALRSPDKGETSPYAERREALEELDSPYRSRLEPLQSPHRVWIEAFRSGKGTSWRRHDGFSAN